jgi:hypothetical protein
MKNVRTQKALEVEDGVFNKGSKVQQYFPYSRNGLVDGHNQEWLIIPAGRRENKFVFYIINNGFLKYLDAILPLEVKEGMDSETQLWTFEKIGQNWLIKSLTANQYLEIPLNSSNDGDPFTLGNFTGQTNQQFILARTGSTFPTSFTGGVALNITPAYADSKALDASGSMDREGEPLKIFDLRKGDVKQQWLITSTPGYYELKPKYVSSKCAEVLNFSMQNSDPAGCFTCVNGSNQKWIIFPVARENGKYIFFNRNSGKCLTVQGGNRTENGSRIIQFNYVNQENCKWKISSAR